MDKYYNSDWISLDFFIWLASCSNQFHMNMTSFLLLASIVKFCIYCFRNFMRNCRLCKYLFTNYPASFLDHFDAILLILSESWGQGSFCGGWGSTYRSTNWCISSWWRFGAVLRHWEPYWFEHTLSTHWLNP